MPIDFGRRSEARACLGTFVHAIFPPGCLPLTQISYLERDLASDSPDGEIAAHHIVAGTELLDLIAGESDRRLLLHVEKVSAAKVVVASRLAAPKIPRVDFDRDGGALGMLGIEPQRALHVLEVPADAGHHHVSNAKRCGRMPGLK